MTTSFFPYFLSFFLSRTSVVSRIIYLTKDIARESEMISDCQGISRQSIESRFKLRYDARSATRELRHCDYFIDDDVADE